MSPTRQPSSFTDIASALDVVRHLDELVWKRSRLASYGVETKKNGSLQYLRRPRTKNDGHADPLDFLTTKSGDKIPPAQAHEDPERGENSGSQVDDEVNIFEQSNIYALVERIDLWESIIRTKPIVHSSGLDHPNPE